ncbi:MAG: glycoside hydrolase family 3 C-terminal domain-containing protein [Acidobacteriota bacterium]
MKRIVGISLVWLFTTCLFGQSNQQAPYMNPDLSPAKRASDLVSKMTLEEKILQMQNYAPAIPRLNIPAYNWWSEALHGVARQGQATVFTQAVGLAAAWDTDLMYRVADVISTEARAKWNKFERSGATIPERFGSSSAGLTYWSPNINIFRDPRWGRGQETYGEDPYLTSEIGVAFVKGMQGNDPHYLKVVATPKHYAVHSGPEPLRHEFDAVVSESDLVNTYLPAFKATIEEGKAESIMCCYNSVDGKPGCASDMLLQKYLRDSWGFNGYVVSDCGAIRDIFQNHHYTDSLGMASVVAVKAGTDLTCGREYASLVDEVKAGNISEDDINQAVERLFIARFKLGMFDPPDRVPFSKLGDAEIDSAKHRQLALEAERDAIVLLKNENQTLPLKSSIKKIAVIGPSADDPVGLLGNYNGVSSKQVTPLEGIEAHYQGKAEVQYRLGASYTSVSPAPLSAWTLTPPTGSGHGLLAEYFDNPDLQGAPKLERVEKRVYLEYDRNVPEITAAIPDHGYSVRWTATLKAPYAGDYTFAIRGFSFFSRGASTKIFLDDKELEFPSMQGQRRRRMQPPEAHITLDAGRDYALRIEYKQPGTGGGTQVLWIPPAAPALADAVDLVKGADVAIVCVGLNSSLEGEEMPVEIPGFEGGDRTSLDLPAPQESLVEEAIKTGKPVVVVLTSGSAIAANYAAEHAAALLEAWYGGEELGTALAQTLAGENNPAGRLPVTFYKSVDQLPPFTDYDMQGHTYRYFKGDPLYSFGYGLSYSSFDYSGLNAKRTGDGAEVSVQVKNTSGRDGDEVVQVYVSGSGLAGDPIRQLAGFQRIHLKAGATQQVQFKLNASQLPKENTKISVGGGQPLDGIPYVETTL